MQGHIPCRITHILRTAHFLIMTKPSSGVCLVVVGETLYCLISHTLYLQFRDAFATQFSPHQFGVATKGKCEVVIHGIMCIFDLHFDWVVF